MIFASYLHQTCMYVYMNIHLASFFYPLPLQPMCKKVSQSSNINDIFFFFPILSIIISSLVPRPPCVLMLDL